ncbi:tetratricopeptide repeat protein [Pedobacter changchengzhani]|uniref:Tetratricopeptide repeat protein n=1 Tax=Pedobacter changchengzhani TaxID=2529274 RepID=A0A4R5MKV5_9SPHI|nr:tetratricopeptide repeat protein [Pedobacter changchengzhani]TDG36056.1 tetratricopeptide repeat protein [Pedobacter changchengzhani]
MKYFKNIALGLITVFFVSCNSSSEDRADQLYKDGKNDEAVTYYEKAIAEGSETAMNKLALLYDNEHQPDKAKEWYIKSFQKGNVKATEYLASGSLRDGNYADVIKYSKPLADKGNKEIVYSLGSAYYKINDYDNAIKYLLKDSSDVATKHILGCSYYAKGDLKNAEKQWREAVDNYRSGAINSYNKLIALYKEQNRMADYNAYKGKYDGD